MYTKIQDIRYSQVNVPVMLVNYGRRRKHVNCPKECVSNMIKNEQDITFCTYTFCTLFCYIYVTKCKAFLFRFPFLTLCIKFKSTRRHFTEIAY